MERDLVFPDRHYAPFLYNHIPRDSPQTQIWFRRGCAAEAAKPVPIFKGHFGGKGYPLLGVLYKKITFCVL